MLLKKCSVKLNESKPLINTDLERGSVALSATSMKWLRILHLISVSIWFGATVCIGVLTIFCFYHISIDQFLLIAPLIPELYQKTILPVAVFTILQGIIYGSLTKWGFIKYRWILLKWILTVLLIPCVGLGTIGQFFSVINKINTAGFNRDWLTVE